VANTALTVKLRGSTVVMVLRVKEAHKLSMRVNFSDGDSNCNGYVIAVIQVKAPFTLELELRAQTCNIQVFDTWI
jgi:hypothetical protein